MNKEALEALRLHVEYEKIPADRGGKDGRKGQAWQRFIEARDAALETPADMVLVPREPTKEMVKQALLAVDIEISDNDIGQLDDMEDEDLFILAYKVMVGAVEESR